MNDASDNRLHDWVRRTLHDYQPPPDPAGWERMRRSRLRCGRPRWPWAVAGVLGLLLLGGSWWWEWQRPEPPSPIRVARTPSAGNAIPAVTPGEGVPGTFPAGAPEPRRVPIRVRTTRESVPTGPERVPEGPGRLTPRGLQLETPDWAGRLARVPLVVPGADELAVRQQMTTGEFGSDSTTYRVLTRNLRRWPDAVVVCDLTSSMAPYTTQLYAWFRKNARHPNIRGLVFFTDCDSLGQETRPGGPPGQFFVTRERDPLRALPTLLAATRNTRANHDDPENDVEALRFAEQAFPQAKHLILLADNASSVKDLDRLDGLRKPVHVVLCGAALDLAQAYPPDYETLARRTRGSLHTLEDDLDPAQLRAGTWLRVGPRFYRYDAQRERFRLTRFRHRPTRLLGLFWW